jgi:3-(3-hydroxy-phenyl)propionate hydroxylase/flavoprotein hydroxylase
VRDIDGAYARWFASAGVAVVLQRPDFYVFGTAVSASGSADLVNRLRRALAAT